MRLIFNRTLASVMLAGCILMSAAGAANAAPGTVTGPNGLTMTVSNTTPIPGEQITITWKYTLPTHTEGTNFMGFTGGANSEQLSFISCVTEASGSCNFHPKNKVLQFVLPVPGGEAGRVVGGSATFEVSPSAAPGTQITYFGYYQHNASPRVETSEEQVLTVAEPKADLGVSLQARAPLLGSSITYTQTVKNHGPDQETSGTITTQLPSQAESLEAKSSGCTFEATTHRVSCPVGALAPEASQTSEYTAIYNLLSLGALEATATRTASTPTDPNPANDSATATCTAITSLIIIC
jgi:hypothetical protein